jgi:hypothetical protein
MIFAFANRKGMCKSASKRCAFSEKSIKGQGARRMPSLLSQSQLAYKLTVLDYIALLDVVEQTLPLPDHLEQAAP